MRLRHIPWIFILGALAAAPTLRAQVITQSTLNYVANKVTVTGSNLSGVSTAYLAGVELIVGASTSTSLTCNFLRPRRLRALRREIIW